MERKGTVAHSKHSNQKMKRTPEDWTPRNLSNWIRNVANSWEGGDTHTQREEKGLGRGEGQRERRY